MHSIEPIPDIWIIEVTPDNVDLLNNWRINIIEYKTYELPNQCKYMIENGSGRRERNGISDSKRNLISIEQFKEYVLNIRNNQSYDYLIPILQKIL